MEEKNRRGGRREGAGRRSVFGPGVDTAQYKLPVACAQACQEYARVMLANNGTAPMRCIAGQGEFTIAVQKGDAGLLQDIVRRWHTCGIGTLDMEIQREGWDQDHVVLRYLDVLDLAEVMREYGVECGRRALSRELKEKEERRKGKS